MRKPRLVWVRLGRQAALVFGSVVGCERLCLLQSRPVSVFSRSGRNRAVKGAGCRGRESPAGRAIGVDDLEGAASQRGHARSKAGLPASVAQWKAEPWPGAETARLADDERLREYVQERLCGEVRRPGGNAVPGPGPAPWKGRNKPRRQDRRWSPGSPEQICNRLKVDFPDDESMRISMRRSTSRSTCRAAARCAASRPRACAPGGRCESRVAGPGAGSTS